MAPLGESPTPDLVTKVRRAQANIQAAIARAALRDDPICGVLEALADTYAILPLFVSDIERIVAAPRPPLTQSEMVELMRAAQVANAAALARAERAKGRRTLVVASVAAAVAVAITGAACFWAGASPRAQTERRLAAAFQDGADAAASWVTLMENNDLPAALAQCRGPRAYADATGRRVCQVPLYVEPPRRAPASSP